MYGVEPVGMELSDSYLSAAGRRDITLEDPSVSAGPSHPVSPSAAAVKPVTSAACRQQIRSLVKVPH